MLGNSDLGMRIYALDRFVDMEELDETYAIPEEFDAENYFNRYFGIIVGDAPVDVVIKTDPYQAKYFRTLPLHHSQKEMEPVDGCPTFKYHIAPTYDFIQELLSHGCDIEVLAPADLRKQIAEISAEMSKIYNGND